MKKRIVIFISLFLLIGLAVILVFELNRNRADLSDSATIISTPVADQYVYEFNDPQWWDHAVFYEIFVRSFNDSNGDGIGDFKGLTAKLDYLNDGDPTTTTDLGITAIWLMPINPSPSYHGYDVTDYYSINPEYGTIEDFKGFLAEAHKRGIHVIMDFVVNHTSVEHPWFIASQDVNSEYRDWYVWSETDPGYMGPWGENVWFPSNGYYYYGVFWEGMPDLNIKNEDVTSEMQKAASFWINDIGLDGFRVDGAKHLIEDGKIQVNTDETITWFQSFNKLYKGWNSNAMTVGEVWDSSEITMKYLESQCFDMVFNFDLANDIVSMVKSGKANSLASSINLETYQYDGYSMGTFLTNHDMDRVMSQLNTNPELAKNAAAILLTIPGTPFIYYGEEIGMTGVKPDEKIRTPMQWSAEENAGFTTGEPWESLNNNFTTANVALESSDTNSVLSFYKDLIRIRMQNPALLDGDYVKVETSSQQLYAGLRKTDSEYVFTLINLKSTDIENPILKFKQGMQPGEYRVEVLLGSVEIAEEITLKQEGGNLKISLPITLAPNENLIIKLVPIK